MSSVPVQIRPLSEDEVGFLEQCSRRPPGMHRDRLARQQEGKVVYLVAWHEGRPVGHVLLEWAGTASEPMASHLKRCPELSDLFVVPEYLSRGIGAQLMEAVESLVRRQGYSQVGLGVAIDNPRARSLYERRGYGDSGLGEYSIRWTLLDEDGQERRMEEVCVYLVKPLP